MDARPTIQIYLESLEAMIGECPIKKLLDNSPITLETQIDEEVAYFLM